MGIEPLPSPREAELADQIAQLQRRIAELEQAAPAAPASPLESAQSLQMAASMRERDRIWQVSRDMLGVADERGVWLSVNPAWTEILGWPAETIVGNTTDWLLHPDDLAPVDADLDRMDAGETVQAVERRLRTRDGAYRLLSWTAVPFEGQRYCVARDVTAERARETALHDSMDFARLALSAVSGVGVWTYEVASDCFFCDAAISALYGIDAQRAALGIKRAEFLANVHPDDVPALRATMSGGLLRSGDLELEYRIRHPDGSTRWVLSRGHTYFDAKRQPVRRTGVGIDMSQQRLMEQQLRQSQKMEAVGQLTGGLAHDFNNLLAAIIGSLDLMTIRLGQGQTGELQRYIGIGKGAATRAAALTHRLLAFSRRQTLDPRVTDVKRLVADMEELVRRTAGPAVAIEVAMAADAWPVLVDANQLENALLNLCINARDAMPDGGRITIRADNQALDQPAAAALGLAAGAYLCLSVADSGTGMTPEVAAHAFEPFFTTKPSGQGTGLGLSMIYGFVRQSGGQLRIDSTPGLGSTLLIYLPRHEGPPGALAKPVPAAGAALPATEVGQTVLVVDDEPLVRLLIVEVLRELGYTVLEAADGAGALALLQSAARIDLLVTDVGLPGGINGRQVADGGRSARPQLKVLFITGYAANSVLVDGSLERGMHLLNKPFPVGEMAARVRQLIADDF